jgi:hypothetical protein
MEKVTELYSYCGGFPEPQACDNPLQYKISWTWNGVLLSYKRPARMIRDGKVVQISARDQFAEQWIEKIDFGIRSDPQWRCRHLCRSPRISKPFRTPPCTCDGRATARSGRNWWLNFLVTGRSKDCRVRSPPPVYGQAPGAATSIPGKERDVAQRNTIVG